MKNLICTLAVLAGSTAQASTLYVDDDATAGGDGSSWGMAYQSLQDALAAASGGMEIRVAQGTYRPGEPGDRTASFQLVNATVLNGGYAGLGAPNPDARNVGLYETILSGDLLDNDGPNFQNNGENSYHVVVGFNVAPSTVLDGFTITAGHANGTPDFNLGAGMFNDQSTSNPTVRNCTFVGNMAAGHGGGMTNDQGSSPTIFNCAFIGNVGAHNGGGMYNFLNSPTVTYCTFVGNIGNRGGGIMSDQSGVSVIGCTFSGNSAIQWGAGLYFDSSDPTVTNCSFALNTAVNGSGVGLNNGPSEITMTNCILWDGGDEISNLDGSKLMVTYTDVQGGFPGTGNIDADPMFVDPDNGDLRLSAHSRCIDVGDNTAVPEGVLRDLDGNPRFVDSTFVGTMAIVDMGAYEFQRSVGGRAFGDGPWLRDVLTMLGWNALPGFD